MKYKKGFYCRELECDGYLSFYIYYFDGRSLEVFFEDESKWIPSNYKDFFSIEVLLRSLYDNCEVTFHYLGE